MAKKNFCYCIIHLVTGISPRGMWRKARLKSKLCDERLKKKPALKNCKSFRDSEITLDIPIEPEVKKEKRIASRAGLHVFKKVVYYIAETNESNVQVSFEHIGFVWMNFEKAMNRLTFADGKRILQKAGEFLSKTP